MWFRRRRPRRRRTKRRPNLPRCRRRPSRSPPSTRNLPARSSSSTPALPSAFTAISPRRCRRASASSAGSSFVCAPARSPATTSTATRSSPGCSRSRATTRRLGRRPRCSPRTIARPTIPCSVGSTPSPSFSASASVRSWRARSSPSPAALPRRPRPSTPPSTSSHTRSRSAWPASIAIRDGSRLRDAMLPSTSTEVAAHFKLHFLGAVLQTVAQLARNLGSVDDVLEQFPFLGDYLAELESRGAPDAAAAGARAAWLASIREWERSAAVHLPLRALRDDGGHDDDALLLLFTIGLIQEDPRFGFVIECAQPLSPGQHRPSLGLLIAWWRDESGVAGVRDRIRALLDCGLIAILNADAPRLQWIFQTPPGIWDALRGESAAHPTPWMELRDVRALP